MSEQKIKIQDFHIGFIYEELEMDSNRYLNQGKIWVTKRYGLKSLRLFKMNKLINDGVIRQKQKIEDISINIEPQQNSINDKNFKKAFIIAMCIIGAIVLFGLIIELINLNNN